MPIIIANEPTSGRGGIQRFAARLARELGRRAPVTIVEPRSNVLDRDVAGVTYRRYAAGPRLKEFVSAAIVYARVIAPKRTDYAIATVWFPSALAGLLVPRTLRGPIGVMANGTEIAPGRGGLRRAVMRFVFARADAIFAVSTFTRGLLVDAGVRAPVRVVFCGVDDADVARSKAEVPTLLSVGRLVARKGFDRLVEAMPQILASVPNAVLEIVGDGPQREQLERLVDALGVRRSVVFHGAVDDRALVEAYARAWCFALPCRRIGDDVEGFGIVYLEAAVQGLPTIGGRASGAEDAIVDGVTGRLVDGDSALEIARAAIEILRDPDEAERMGSLGAERAREAFSWTALATIVDDTMRAKQAAS